MNKLYLIRSGIYDLKECLTILWIIILVTVNILMIVDLFVETVEIGEFSKRNKIETFILLTEFIILTAFVLFM